MSFPYRGETHSQTGDLPTVALSYLTPLPSHTGPLAAFSCDRPKRSYLFATIFNVVEWHAIARRRASARCQSASSHWHMCLERLPIDPTCGLGPTSPPSSPPPLLWRYCCSIHHCDSNGNPDTYAAPIVTTGSGPSFDNHRSTANPPTSPISMIRHLTLPLSPPVLWRVGIPRDTYRRPADFDRVG